MRLLTRHALVLAVALCLTACDAEDELAPCSFEATISEYADVQLSGAASFGYFNDAVFISMGDRSQDSLASVGFSTSIGPQDSRSLQGEFSLQRGFEPEWVGQLESASYWQPWLRFFAVDGTLRISPITANESGEGVSEDLVQGTFSMEAVDIRGDTLLVEGAFNAESSLQCVYTAAL